MPIYADPPHGPAVRLVADDDLTMLATFVAEPGRPPAVPPHASDLRAVAGTDLDRLARVLTADLPGVQVTTDPDVAAALVAAGARPVATMVTLDWDLEARPPPLEWAAPALAQGLRLEGVHLVITDRPVLDDPSAAIVDGSGQAVAQLVVVPVGNDALVADIGQHAGPAGLAQALLERALTVCALAGIGHLGLRLDEDDPAVASLQAMGFEAYERHQTVLLPEGPGA